MTKNLRSLTKTVIEAAMKRKRKDEVKHRRELIKVRNRMRKEMMEEMGMNSNRYKKTMRDLQRITQTTEYRGDSEKETDEEQYGV